MPHHQRIGPVGLFMAGSIGLMPMTGLAADGLRGPDDTTIGSRWQPRIGFSTIRPWWQSSTLDEQDAGSSRVASISLLGDYYFGAVAHRAAAPAGFRATSGLLLRTGNAGLADAAWKKASAVWGMPVVAAGTGSAAAAALPYVGLGYTLAPGRHGWGFSADIGVVANNPARAIRLGRLAAGPQALDDLLRDLRLSPQLNLGVSYSF